MKKIAIVGGGVLGRLTALRLAQKGAEVTVFERDQANGLNSSAAVAAGMIAPYCELESADLQIHRLGLQAIPLWKETLGKFSQPVFWQTAGSLVVAHSKDRAELERLRRFVHRAPGEPGYKVVQGIELSELEPGLDARFTSGLYFPHEAQIDTRGFLLASAHEMERRGVRTLFTHKVDDPRSKCGEFACVIDTRGIQGKDPGPNKITGLRGVRGEVIRVHAPDVVLNRPVRLVHPRFPIYIVPRPDHHFVIGASQIESEDLSPISIRSALELLSAAFTLHSGFAEARILEMRSGLRPAFPDNMPRIVIGDGWLEANGLYRHGFLIAPKIAEILSDLALDRQPDTQFAEIYGKTPTIHQ